MLSSRTLCYTALEASDSKMCLEKGEKNWGWAQSEDIPLQGLEPVFVS